MTITITRPTAHHHIITDMQALADSIRLANRIRELEADEPATEADASRARKERSGLHRQLKDLLERTRKSTLTVVLRGLPSSQWTQITLKHTDNMDGRIVKDLPAIAAEAAPLMLETAQWPDGTDAGLDRDAFTALIGQMTDSQVAELMQTVQELNTPVTEVPKAVARMI